MGTTDSFVITTLDSSDRFIDRASSGMTVTIVNPGSITINSVNIGNKGVD